MDGDLLVLNAGSSSIKASIFGPGDADGPTLQVTGQVEGLGVHPHAVAKDAAGKRIFEKSWPNGDGPRDHHAAMALIVENLGERRPGWKPVGVGHRVVHGGPHYREPVAIDDAVRAELQKLAAYAPLHLPGNLAGIDAARRAFPDALQVACFDTSFHQGHPWVADAFALPRNLYDEGVRRYGFHGLSYAYIVRAMRRIGPQVAAGRMIVAHLGNGASMCAIRNGQSIDSTMSLTALDGLCMGTRCGQLDPGVMLYLLEAKKLTPTALGAMLYKQSGLLGLSGISSDMRDLLQSSDPRAKQAVDYFVYRVVCSAGALTAALGGLDGLVFTGGIGEHAAEIRARVCQGLAWLGITLDVSANGARQTCITTKESRVPAWVVPTDEERMIALHVGEIMGVSAR